jgi:hypothetical protein
MERLMDSVRQKATAQLDTQKDRATDSISVIAAAVRGTTDQLRSEHHEGLAGYIDNVADQLERFSTSLRDKDLGELLTDARQLARRQPALVIGGGFLIGLAAARFLKSSRGDGDRSPGDRRSGVAEATPSASTGDADHSADVAPSPRPASAPAGAGRS